MVSRPIKRVTISVQLHRTYNEDVVVKKDIIVNTVCKIYGISKKNVLNRGMLNKHTMVVVRDAKCSIIYLLNKHLKLKQMDTGHFMGGIGGDLVRNYLKMHENRINNKSFADFNKKMNSAEKVIGIEFDNLTMKNDKV